MGVVLDLTGIRNYKKDLEEVLNDIVGNKIVSRIWEKDHTVWKDDPAEISNRLGWLDSVRNSKKALLEIYDFVESIKADGFKNALVLGMGGSSLAPEVFSLIFGADNRLLNVYVLDSTHPKAVKEYLNKLNLEETLFVVSTKSGGTVETLSFMKYFYNTVQKHLPDSETGKYFAAITDPGSGLEELAKKLNFRKIFLNDPDIGGRYSALSFFGLVPAALVGVDLEQLLANADQAVMKSKLESQEKILENNSAVLGGLIGTLANKGIDKLTLLYSDKIKYFGAWLEQLIAESTGKDGKGILPVDLEKLQEPKFYKKDRLFIYVHLRDEKPYDQNVFKLKEIGLPVVEVILDDIYALGAEYFNWEFATAIAGWKLGIQPFDQPNVESAKVQARNLVQKFKEEGKLPNPESKVNENDVKLYTGVKGNSIEDVLNNFFSGIDKIEDKKELPYISLQAFVKPDEETFDIFQQLREKLHKKFGVATTFGFGPRFLHSTGQLHKGDAGNGYFLQFISDGKDEKVDIPDNAGEDKSGITFDVLIRAQALGDRQALLDNNRNVVTFDIDGNVDEAVKYIMDKL